MKIKKISFFKKKRENRIKKKIFSAYARILSTFNNTIVTITDKLGSVISWSTCSSVGFKGPKKSSPYPAQLAGERVGRKVYSMGVKEIDIVLKGMGPGREPAVRGLANTGLIIKSISDFTPLPHNGCKPRKLRRN